MPWPRRLGSASIVLPLAAFALATLLIPVMAPVAIWDDWAYVRAAETLAATGELAIPAPAAANVVFQAVWGAAFQIVFGSGIGVLRLSTVVLVALSAVALHALLRLLSVGPVLRGLGVTVYLFQPLGFVLSFSFMTDSHYVALFVIGLYFVIRGLKEASPARSFVLGSLAWSAAYLVRPQAMLAAMAAGAWVWHTVAGRPARERISLALSVVACPLLAAIGLAVWADLTGAGNQAQGAFVASVQGLGVRGGWLITHRSLFVAAAYIGLFCLPLLPLMLAALARRRRQPGLAVSGLVAIALLVDGWLTLPLRKTMPFAPSWLELGGLGPEETPGRAALLGQPAALLLTLGCLMSVTLVVLCLTSAERSKGRQGGLRPLLLIVGASQVAGMLLPSYPFTNPLDRYLLPLLPVIICLVAMSVREVRAWASWMGVILAIPMAVFSIVDTRNFLVSQETKWAVAGELLASGVGLAQLDAGAGWDGYRTYDQLDSRDLAERPEPLGRWWMNAWGRGIDSTYIIWGGPLPGYDVVRTVQFDQWIRQDRLLYVNRRTETAPVYGPPSG